jgi:hypothetical protein
MFHATPSLIVVIKTLVCPIYSFPRILPTKKKIFSSFYGKNIHLEFGNEIRSCHYRETKEIVGNSPLPASHPRGLATVLKAPGENVAVLSLAQQDPMITFIQRRTGCGGNVTISV